MVTAILSATFDIVGVLIGAFLQHHFLKKRNVENKVLYLKAPVFSRYLCSWAICDPARSYEKQEELNIGRIWICLVCSDQLVKTLNISEQSAKFPHRKHRLKRLPLVLYVKEKWT